MRKRTIATIIAFGMLSYALFASLMLSALPKFIVLTQAITISDSTPEKTLDYLYELIPRELYWAHWEFNRFQECIYVYEGKSDSYVTMLASALMITDKDRGVTMDYKKAERILKQLVNNGCSVNYPDSEYGWLPIHTAVVLLNNNPDIGFYIAMHGANFDAKLPATDEHFPSMNAREVIEKLLQIKPSDVNLIKMQKITNSITISATRTPALVAPPPVR